MVSEEARRDVLAALSVAAAELIEDHHDELVAIFPNDVEAQHDRMQRLRKLGMDLMALGEAGLVLLQNPQDDSRRSITRDKVRPPSQ